MEYLITHRATPALNDNKWFNALHYAAAAGNTTAVQHLLEYGGTELFSQAGEDQTTPLHLAAFNGHKDALVVLLSR